MFLIFCLIVEQNVKKELLLAKIPKEVQNGVIPSGKPEVKVPSVPKNCTTPECAGAELMQPEEDPPTTEEQKMDHFVSVWLTHVVNIVS